jgi:hypothetical protein
VNRKRRCSVGTVFTFRLRMELIKNVDDFSGQRKISPAGLRVPSRKEKGL